MNIIEYFIEKNTANVTMEFTVEEVNQHIRQAYVDINQNATLPGFRKGKAPLNVLKSRYSLADVQEDILKSMIKVAFNHFMQEKKDVQFIQYPYMKSVEPLQENKPYQIKMFADIYPQVTPADIVGKEFEIEVSKTVVSIVQDKINALLETHATYSDLEKPEKQDYAIIEYAYTETETMNGVKSPKTQMISLLNDSIQEGLNDKIMTMAVGEYLFYPLPETNDHPNRFVYVKVIGWKRKELPQLNQEFLDAIQSGKQLDAFMNEINRASEAEYNRLKNTATIETVLDYLVINSTFEDIPENLYNHYLEKQLADLENEITKMKLTWEKYLELTQQTEESLKKEMEPELIKQIKLDLLFRHFAMTHPELAPSEENVKQEAQLLHDRFQKEGHPYEMVKLENYMRENLNKGNIMDWLVKDVKTKIKPA